MSKVEVQNESFYYSHSIEQYVLTKFVHRRRFTLKVAMARSPTNRLQLCGEEYVLGTNILTLLSVTLKNTDTFGESAFYVVYVRTCVCYVSSY